MSEEIKEPAEKGAEYHDRKEQRVYGELHEFQTGTAPESV